MCHFALYIQVGVVRNQGVRFAHDLIRGFFKA